MFECLILGDSIARGIANIRKECNHLTEIGINSAEWNRKYGQSMLITEIGAKTTVISLGSNDTNLDKLERELRQIRGRVKERDVIWILPSERKLEQRHIVSLVAASNNDRMLEIPSYSADGIHPNVRGYDELVKRTR